MEPGLDKNGNWIQRRKMYDNQFPLHNLKSQFKFDWQGDQHSFQDMHGHKYRIKLQNQKLIRKYNENLDKKIQLKYVECVDDNQLFMQNMKTIIGQDTLNKQVEQFNHSKLMSSRTIEPKHDIRQSHQHDYNYNAIAQGNLSSHRQKQTQDIENKIAQYNSKIRRPQYDLQKEQPYENNIESSSLQYVPKYVPKYPNYLNYNTILPNNYKNNMLQPRRLSQSYNKQSYNLQKSYKNSLNPEGNILNKSSTYQNHKSPKINLNLNDLHT